LIIAGLTPVRLPTIPSTTHRRSNGINGPSSRCTREASQTEYPRPSRKAADQEAELEYPPTMKKTGMTWKPHDNHWVQGEMSSM